MCFTPRLTLAVCSNNPSRVKAYSSVNVEQLGPDDRLLIIFDMDASPEGSELATLLRSEIVEVVFNGSGRGLSQACNLALRTARTKFIVFVDDDVTFSRSTIEDIRASFGAGGQVVGVWLEPGPNVRLARWYISPSQYHYLGLHREDVFGTTWGACMGFDLEFIRLHDLTFRMDLGRNDRTLASGEDTTFVRECITLRASEVFLNDSRVQHHVASDRLRLSRVLSRALWQGRFEGRRDSAYLGALKEWRRNACRWRQEPVRRICLALLYQTMVLMRLLVEFLARTCRVSHSIFTEKRIKTYPPLGKPSSAESCAESCAKSRGRP